MMKLFFSLLMVLSGTGFSFAQQLTNQELAGVKWTALTTLAPVEKRVGYGNFVSGKLMFEGQQVKVKKVMVLDGFFAHAPSRLVFDIAGKGYTAFRGKAGLQDGHFGDIQFQILGDDKELWKSDVIRKEAANMDPKEARFAVDITHVGKLTLVVDPLGSGTDDHSVWVSPEIGKK